MNMRRQTTRDLASQVMEMQVIRSLKGSGGQRLSPSA